MRKLVALARPQRQARVLDIATGAGHTAFAFAPFVSGVIAVDITREMIDEARRLQDRNGLRNVDFALAAAAELPFADQAFDIVTCRRAAHHFSDIRGALGEMNRVLAIGGRLIIDDRSVPEDDFVDATMNELDTLHDESHVREYRPREWVSMLEEARFKVDAVSTHSKQRPLSSLSADVAPDRVARINAIIRTLDAEQRLAMNVAEKQGQVFTNHWFVMVAATRI
ncbi:MAG: methyltransferase domain-containing protein [Dehalococcoidia bacterium]